MNKAAYAVLIALASYGSAFAGSNVYDLVEGRSGMDDGGQRPR